MSGVCIAPDGNLVVMEIQYKSWSEAPDGMDSSSNEYWEYYKYEQTYYIRWLEPDGTEISCAPVEIDPDTYLDTYNMKLDNDGNLVCLYDGRQIVGIAPDGKFSYNIGVDNDSYIDSIVKLADGTIAASISSGSGTEVRPIETANKKLSDTSYPLENIYLYNAISGSNGYDLYYTNGTNFYGLKLETGEQEKLFSWLSCDVNGNDMNSVTVREDGSVVGVITDYDSSSRSYSYEMVTVKQVPYESVPKKEIITLGCIGLQYQTQDMIVKFNRGNDKYRIEVTDYSEYNNEENGYDAGLTKLNTEIMAGNVPDILDISSLNYVQLASKGIIEDLYPYIDAYEELNRDAILPMSCPPWRLTASSAAPFPASISRPSWAPAPWLETPRAGLTMSSMRLWLPCPRAANPSTSMSPETAYSRTAWLWIWRLRELGHRRVQFSRARNS